MLHSHSHTRLIRGIEEALAGADGYNGDLVDEGHFEDCACFDCDFIVKLQSLLETAEMLANSLEKCEPRRRADDHDDPAVVVYDDLVDARRRAKDES